MSLGKLSARDLARIDAVCLDFENALRRGESPSLQQWVQRHGGQHASELERELELLLEEMRPTSASHPPMTRSVDEGSAMDLSTAKLPESGAQLGPYTIEYELGRGGMGVVFAATDSRLGRKVAIKMLAVETAQRRKLTERFERESRAVAALSHPNIVELFDVGFFDDLPYAVMEFLDGELLDAQLKRGQWEPAEVRRLGAQIADALAAAHASGVVHRDLKPHNIMLVPRSGSHLSGVSRTNASSNSEDEPSSQGTTIVKLFDFGLARAPLDLLGIDVEEKVDGVIMGTPGYMAPEQARGETVTPAADLFSLGCVLYEAFYGKRAFEGRTHAHRFTATLRSQPPDYPERRFDDPELAALIDELLQKDPKTRPESASEVARRLRDHRLSSRETLAQPMLVGGEERISRRRMMAVGMLGLGGTLAGSVFWNPGVDQLSDIESLAVLSLAGPERAPTSNPRPGMPPPPVGESELDHGQQLSALLVHELTRLSDLRVPRFRPLVAETPEDFRKVGEMLEVDALLTGTINVVEQGSTEFLQVDLQIISAVSGKQLWSKRLHSEAGENYLEQSKLATEIASAIGHRLLLRESDDRLPTLESFHCLVNGHTRSDPDSMRGLEMALTCFQRAHNVDRSFAEPVAGIALTSITLAAQSPIEKAITLVQQARESSEEALRLDAVSVDARLASAMLDWQTVARFKEAERKFQELVVVAPNHWQVRHQYGLLLLTQHRYEEASRSLREAALLNPLSVMAKIDLARTAWYRDHSQRAIDEAIRIRERYEPKTLARGLLIDIYEQQQRFDLAAAEHQAGAIQETWTAERYYAFRRQQLAKLPYGPFGDVCNQAIWQARSSNAINEITLANWSDPLPPMLPMLLAAHPAFATARQLQTAQPILPS